MRRQRIMRRQVMCRHNASSGDNASSEDNASSGNVSSQCVVRGNYVSCNVSSESVVSVSGNVDTPFAGALYNYMKLYTCFFVT